MAEYEESVALHKRGAFAQAQAGYRAHLAAHPQDAVALAQLAAVTLQGGGKCEEAVALARRAVQLQPGCARLRHTLGRLLEKGEPPRWAEAADAYARACEKDPGNVQMLLDLARALKELDRTAAAAEAYARALELAPDHPRAHFKLAMALRAMGRMERAAEHFRRHLEIDPGHTAARFWLAACTGNAADAAACPPDMVAGLFDQYAEKFDSHLVEVLSYRTPQLLLDLLVSAAGGAGAPSPWRACADLGCGTGLMGPLLRPLVAGRLVGVDLSAGMCDKARERGCYDAVEVGELVEWLQQQQQQQQQQQSGRGQGVGGQQQQSAKAFDLLVAADVLVYIGDLEALFSAAAAVTGAGALFALSTEFLPEASEEGPRPANRTGGPAGRGFRLQATGRYAHAASYLRGVGTRTGWRMVALERAVIRTNAGKPIHGNLCVLQRVECGSGDGGTDGE